MLLGAACLAAIFSVQEGGLHLTRPAVGWGVISGGFIFLTTTAFFQVMRHGRLAIQWTVLNMSLAIPTLASIVIWGEEPTPLLLLGMGLVVLALVFMGIDKRQSPRRDDVAPTAATELSPPALLKWIGLVAFSFVTTGMVQVCNKAFVHETDGGSLWTYVFVGQMVGGILAAGYVGLRREWPRRTEMLLGSAMALGIVAAAIFMLKALEQLPGTVVFPLRTSLVTLLTAALSVGLWKERLHWPGVVGIAVAVAAVYCLGAG
jgi:drug/metabolite transporter (DMT)-like permease